MTFLHKIPHSILRTIMFLSLLMGGQLCWTSCTRTSTAEASTTISHSKQSEMEENQDEADAMIDLPASLQEGVYYVGQFKDEELILIFDNISRKKFNGSIYTIEPSGMLQRSEMNGKMKQRKCTIKLAGHKNVLRGFTLQTDGDGFKGECALGCFSFRSYAAPAYDTIEKMNRYAEECFEIETIKDIKYGNAKGYWVSRPETSKDYGKIIASGIANTLSKKDFDLYMDLYLPKDDTLAERPLVLFIHGGGFFIGDKRDNPIVLWCQHFAKMGYVAASINYRMGFRPSKSSIERCGYCAVQDAHAAMRFLIHNAKKYRINPDYLFAAGSSAGGITTLNLAFMRNTNRPESSEGGLLNEDLGDIASSGNSLKESFRMRCIANMWGSVHDISMIDNQKVSIISFHGDADQVVPYGTDVPFKDLDLPINNWFFNKMYGSKTIHDRAKKLGYREELHTFKGCGHAPHVDDNNRPTDKFYFIQEKTTDFFYKEFGSDNIQVKPTDKQRFVLTNNKVETSSWRITGGLILSYNNTSVRAVWFPEAKTHTLECTGRLLNGAGFTTQYTPDIQ